MTKRRGRPPGHNGYRLCETCGCFKSAHRYGRDECQCGQCSVFTFTPPRRTRDVHRLTEDEITRAETMLQDGATYAEVGRTLGFTGATVRNRFPGYGDNAKSNVGVPLNQAWRRLDRVYKARRTLLAEQRTADGRVSPGGCAFEGGNVCDRPHYGLGLCRAHYLQYRRHGELKPIRGTVDIAQA